MGKLNFRGYFISGFYIITTGKIRVKFDARQNSCFTVVEGL